MKARFGAFCIGLGLLLASREYRLWPYLRQGKVAGLGQWTIARLNAVAVAEQKAAMHLKPHKRRHA